MAATMRSARVLKARTTTTRRGARRSAAVVAQSARPASAAALASPSPAPLEAGLEDVLPSGLNFKALMTPPDDQLPTRGEVIGSVPEHCFKRDTTKSMAYAACSTAITAALGAFAWAVIPLKLAYWPAWVAYALVTGTAATGCWVIAHECGHNAFSDNRTLQDAVGYVLHSILLVPYFSWQRSHAVHHSRTNHVTEGETHVPYSVGSLLGDKNLDAKAAMGEGPFAIFQLIGHLVFGWPAYLFAGATGGPVRGLTNHFWPTAPFSEALWPGKWKEKVLRSDVGVAAVLAGLCVWGAKAGLASVAALYVGPYLVTNVWLVLYTWLQHTDTDVPHFEDKNWSFVKGAFMTIDRPYGATLDFLHHRIGSTHVAHHVESAIPHYHALDATNALKEKFPELYLYDPTPVLQALWRVATKCVAVDKRGDRWVFIAEKEQRQYFGEPLPGYVAP